MEQTTSIPSRKSTRWLRLLGFLAAGLVVFVLVAYFVVTSGPFFNSVILPKVGAAMNADVTVRSASISPFSQVVLQGLTVKPKGADQLLTAEKVTARYDLMDIIGGRIVVHEATLDSPVITIIQNADGTSNLDPILHQSNDSPEQPDDKKDPAKPADLQIEKLAINNGLVRITKNYGSDKRDTTEVSGLNLAVTNVRNGQAGKAVLSAQLKIDNQPPGEGTNAPVNGRLEGGIAGNFEFKLMPDLQPESISGQTRVDVQSAQGAFAQMANLGAELVCEISPTEVKALALKLSRGPTALGEVRVSGPFDPVKTEGQLLVVVTGIDAKTLNIFGAPSGLDFGSTTVGATNLIKITRGGSVVETTGQLDLNRFAVKQQNQVTPALDLHLRFQTTVDRSNQVAQLQAFTLDGLQNGQPLLRGGLTSPMTIALDGKSNALGDSALQLSVTNLNLADWQALAGQTNLSGLAGLDLTLLAQQAGNGLTLSMKASVSNLGTDVGSNRLSNIDVKLGLNSQVRGMDRVDLERCQFELLHQQNRVLAATVSGVYLVETKIADLQIDLENRLPELLKMLPQEGVSATAGLVQLRGRVQQTNTTHSFRGDFQLREFTGAFGDSKFTNYTTVANLDVGADAQAVALRNITVTIMNRGVAGGQMVLAGNYDLAATNFSGSLKLDGLNQNALEPFLGAALGETKLLAISLNGSATTRYAPQGKGVDATISVTNLIVQEANKPTPNPPLALQLRADIAQENDNLDLRQVRLGLTPTDRAKNELTVTGRLNMADPNITQGNIKISAESLDVTPYYDLFASSSTTSNAPSATEPPAAKGGKTPAQPPATEPPATSVPFRNFDLELEIGALYLREIEIKKWHAKTHLDGTNVALNPFQLDLNGAPINAAAKVNLGVPGYQYDVSFDVAKLPVEPLANTFIPDKRGMYKGHLLTKGSIKGLGTTGPNLRQHLNAEFGLSFTNAELQILSPKLKRFLTPIAILLTVPDVTKSPITYVNVSANASQGKIDLKRTTIVSAAFLAETSGQIPISDDLMKSPLNAWPVAFSLRRSMAERIQMVSKEASPTNDYVRLPDFVKVVGTMGEPEAKLDKLALAGSVLEKYADRIPGLDDKASNALKGLGSLIGGNKGAPNTNVSANATTNNPASTNQAAPAPRFNPLDLLKKPRK